jgi:hypothetical protein
MVMSHNVAMTLPPPIAYPCTRAITGLGTSRIALCNSSIGKPAVPRPSYCPECADWSPPVQNARSPVPPSTTAAMFLSQPDFSSACSISSTVWPRNAFITSGRLIEM